MTTQPRPFVKRRQRLIKTRFQLRLIAIFAGIALLAQLFQTLLMGSYLAQLAARMPAGGPVLAEETPGVLVQTLAASSLLLLPLILLVGISATFRIAGPLYRFDQYLKGLKNGSEVELCRLRRGDQLQDLCQVINEATEPLRARNAARLAAESSEREAA
ncbi:hypothetical protein [Engelhardtia mirabilis]|uniref:HAMP domain-containing protein n=1 Tax=Engelhardtia mirabilis TaxID=2528011 RepID=A0A518BEK4_9BACT|nr:hypothetical protein Pla133_04750 [Planctomycetes bacterium Pla133]QDU99736.1 hypothetical protein Pla86_04750 [Planctomycetes bacterium Pla86]